MKRIGIILSIGIIGLSGCVVSERTIVEHEPAETEITIDVNEEDKNSSTMKDSEAAEKELLGTIIEDVSKGVNRLAEAVIAQFTIQYKDGTTDRLSEDGILFETVIGNIGIIATKLPDRDGSFGVFTYSRDKEWVMHGIQNFSVSDASAKVRHGLDLPQDKMFIINSELKDIEQPVELWTLYDETQLITILSTDVFSGAEGELIERRKGANERYRLDQPNGDGLFYFDQGKLVVVTGNVSEEVLLRLSDSLPEALSPDFPMK